jgi:NAD(P)-dependent dehydrogenase (short-subunit alcohol dehydrogenase family)
MSDLQDRVIAISGASRGIGYFAALEMIRQGAHVIAIARTVGGLEELDDEATNLEGSCTLVPLDITDFASIDRLGGQIAQRWGKLDGFIGNAGLLGGLAPLGHVEPKTFDKVIATNVTANWRFIRSFDTLLKASESGRVLFMTSAITRSRKAFWGPYAMSKSAVETMAAIYAAECTNTGIKINLYDPGPVGTALRTEAMPGEDEGSLVHPKELASSIASLLAEDLSHTGKIYSYLTGKFSDLQ